MVVMATAYSQHDDIEADNQGYRRTKFFQRQPLHRGSIDDSTRQAE
jgi:hypothetical protein